MSDNFAEATICENIFLSNTYMHEHLLSTIAGKQIPPQIQCLASFATCLPTRPIRIYDFMDEPFFLTFFFIPICSGHQKLKNDLRLIYKP